MGPLARQWKGSTHDMTSSMVCIQWLQECPPTIELESRGLLCNYNLYFTISFVGVFYYHFSCICDGDQFIFFLLLLDEYSIMYLNCSFCLISVIEQLWPSQQISGSINIVKLFCGHDPFNIVAKLGIMFLALHS